MVIYVSRTVREDQLLNQFLRFGRRDFQSTIGMLDPKLKSCLHFAGSFCINHQVDQIEGTLLHRVIVIYRNLLFHVPSTLFYHFQSSIDQAGRAFFALQLNKMQIPFSSFQEIAVTLRNRMYYCENFIRVRGPFGYCDLHLKWVKYQLLAVAPSCARLNVLIKTHCIDIQILNFSQQQTSIQTSNS